MQIVTYAWLLHGSLSDKATGAMQNVLSPSEAQHRALSQINKFPQKWLIRSLKLEVFIAFS